jgi:SAM-dependent methyltransferase
MPDAEPTPSNPWTRPGGAWVELQPMLDRLFQPFEGVLTGSVGAGARHVLDIGCGAGATTRAVARGMAEGGDCTGLDISAPLIEVAERRTREAGIGNARFLVGDGQILDLGSGRFDVFVSRFGVMFFGDPAAAFANLRRAAAPGAEMTLIVWRAPAENPFMIAAEQAAAPFLPQLAPHDLEAPGQFGFANPDRVRRILAPGWRGIDIQPLDVACEMSADDLRIYERRMGRVGLMLPELDAGTRDAVLEAVARASEAFVTDGTARFTAACWIVQARAA